MTIRPTAQPVPLPDEARPKMPTIPRQTAPAPADLEFVTGNGIYSTQRGELDNRFFDESSG